MLPIAVDIVGKVLTFALLGWLAFVAGCILIGVVKDNIFDRRNRPYD